MFYLIRQANQNDIPQLAKMLEDYIQETYQGAWGGTAELLEQHISTGAVEITAAETSGFEIVAFIASIITYDLHYCMKGGEIIDFYVSLLHRGRGAAVFLITGLAAEVQKRGGAFLKGGAVENEIVRRLYGRIAMCQPNGECYVSGRAFRHLAGLSSGSLREIVRNLPETAWNYEP
jgi:GNAT superfamily N-acetyltransferase